MAKRPFKKQEQEQECSDPYEDGEEEVEYTRKKVMIRVVSAGQRMSSLVPLMSYSSDSSSSSSSTSTSTCYGNIIGGSDSIGSLRCQADECGVDLKMAKTYHKRHKVCERHAKAAVVLVTGIRQRFCQQCSKFHEISQFDDNKKSCREKLAGHNERRRKTYADLQAENKQKPPTSIMGGGLLKAMRYSNYGEKSLPGSPNMKHCRINFK
ncbi:squamosa promoter-binding protein 1 [Quercus suber]|uniref:Squamosa promoter-binding-like protein 4 n=1 Tax=Quercus suber TaxID=58331 RepID=A0AAW0LP55_QUESU|nr:squamosa promoter-binding protein 1-like [Quercus suber]